MPAPEHIRQVGELLDGLSDAEVRELCIEALRRWHQRSPVERHFQMHGHLGRELIPLLATRKRVELGDANALKEVFLFGTEVEQQTSMTGVLEFVEWFVRAGFAVPLPGGTNRYPITLRLTRAGVRFLDRADDHPLLPAFVERIRTRCPGLPDDVVALLTDARACLDQMLLRPAVVVMGVAYEAAVERVAEALVTAGTLPAEVLELRAAARIARVRGVIDARVPGGSPEERDRRFAVHAAFAFADQLRRRRNDASHTTPRFGFEDREEIEELLVSAGRHLPALWSIAPVGARP